MTVTKYLIRITYLPKISAENFDGINFGHFLLISAEKIFGLFIYVLNEMK